MTIRKIAVVFACLVFAGVCRADGVGVSGKLAGQEDLRMTLQLERTELIEPEDIWSLVEIVNDGTGVARISMPGIYNGICWVYFDVEKWEGESWSPPLEYQGVQRDSFGGMRAVTREDPIQIRVDLRHYYDFSSPGRYKIKAMYRDPETGFRLSSGEQVIELREPDTAKVLAVKKIRSHADLEVLFVEEGGEGLLMLARWASTDKGRHLQRCRRIEIPGLARADLAATIAGFLDGHGYEGVEIGFGGERSVLVNVPDNGPRVFSRLIEKPHTELEMKEAEDGKLMLVDREGKEYGTPDGE
jgi:hypothetical protein